MSMDASSNLIVVAAPTLDSLAGHWSLRLLVQGSGDSLAGHGSLRKLVYPTTPGRQPSRHRIGGTMLRTPGGVALS